MRGSLLRKSVSELNPPAVAEVAELVATKAITLRICGVKRDRRGFCECSLMREKGDKETSGGGGGTKAITAKEPEGLRDRHRFSACSPAVAMVNK